jgi:hypothetical protein
VCIGIYYVVRMGGLRKEVITVQLKSARTSSLRLWRSAGESGGSEDNHWREISLVFIDGLCVSISFQND